MKTYMSAIIINTPLLLLIISATPIAVAAPAAIPFVPLYPPMGPVPPSASRMSISLVAIECNEDGTYYAGDSLLLNYAVPPSYSGAYVDGEGRLCDYGYDLQEVQITGCLEGSSSAPTASIACQVLPVQPGMNTARVTARYTFYHHYFVNETYPIYTNGTLMGWDWRWTETWDYLPCEIYRDVTLQVAEYDPRFTFALYPVVTRATDETTFQMDLVLLARYEGNGPDHNLRQRAVVDSCIASATGSSLFMAASPDDVSEAIGLGFQTFRPATLEDIVARQDLESLGPLAPLLSQLMGINSSPDMGFTVYIAERECMEYGPIPTALTTTTFNSTNRYARYVLTPGASPVTEEAGVQLMHVKVRLPWSRMGYGQLGDVAEATIPFIRVRQMLTVRTVAYASGQSAIEMPASACVNITMSLLDQDVLFPDLFEPPASVEEDGWFAEQWKADSVCITQSVLASACGDGIGGQAPPSCLVPRSSSTYYNLTYTITPPPGGYVCIDPDGTPLPVSPSGILSGSIMTSMPFDDREYGITININPFPGQITQFRDHPSWDDATVDAGPVPLSRAVVFTQDGGERQVWRAFSWDTRPPQAASGDESSLDQDMRYSYYIWAMKPDTLDHSAPLYVELTDVWGNTQVLLLGTATPYAAGIGDIPLSGIVTVSLLVAGAALVYTLLQKLADRR